MLYACMECAARTCNKDPTGKNVARWTASFEYTLLTLRFTAEEKAKRPQLCYVPFGYGPRNCIGMRFAMLEAKLVLVELLRKFSFVRAPDTQARQNNGRIHTMGRGP